MAISYTSLFNSTDNSTTNGSHTLDASLGTVNSGTYLICAAFTTKVGSASSSIFSISQPSGTGSIGSITTIDDTCVATVNFAAVGLFATTVTSTGTITLRFDDNVGTYGIGAIVISITGHDTVTPIAGLIKNNNTSIDGAISLTLSATPTTDDLVLGFLNSDTNTGSGKGVDVGSGFIEVAEAGGTSDFVMAQGQARTGSTSTSVPWADVKTTGAPTTFSTAAGAFIVKAAPPVASSTFAGISTISGISSITL